MKNFYMAVTIQGDKNEIIFDDTPHEYEPGYYSYVHRIHAGQNMCFALDCIGGLVSATICESKKHAENLVNAWNAGYKQNGTYLYDVPAF